MATKNFTVTVIDSYKEISTREKIKLMSLEDCIALNEVAEAVIDFDNFAVLNIHNEASENKDYTVYVIFDKDGTRYQTSSETFFDKMSNIIDVLVDDNVPENEWQFKLVHGESKNYKGKEFLSCTLA